MGARRNGTVWLLAALALATVGIQLATLHPEPTWRGDDYAAYMRDASDLLRLQPEGMRHYVVNPNIDVGIGAYPPLYPLLLTIPIGLFGEDYGAADAFTLLLFGAGLFAFMVYARPLIGTPATLMAGLVVGLGPFIVFWKNAVMSEFCFLLVLFLALLAARRYEAEQRGGWVLALIVAAAVLTRAVGAALWPALILAELMRTSRVRPATVGAVALSIIVTAAAMLAANADVFPQYLHLIELNAVLQRGDGGRSVSVADRLTFVWGNLRDAPGNLALTWSFGSQLVPGMKAGWMGLLSRGITLLLLLAGALGLMLRLRRGASLAETFFLLELAGFLAMPRLMISGRLYLPLSVLLLLYIFVGAGALARYLGQPTLATRFAAFVLLAAGAATGLAGVLALPPERFTMDRPPAQEFFAWARSETKPDSLFITRSPRALIFYTGRGGVDYHLDHADTAFLEWARSVGAEYLVLNIDLAEVHETAAQARLPETPDGLNRALDLYEEKFFGAGRERFRILFRNAWFRAYRVES